VTSAVVFIVIATVQAVFLVLLMAFVAVRRGYDRQRRAAFLAGQEQLAEPLRNWIVAGSHPEPVVHLLRTLPRGTAVGYVSLLARQIIPPAQRDELSEALRNEPWIADAIGQRGSRFWWRRLEAARAVSIIGTARDREVVRALLRDPHPAVQVAAAAALPRVADAAMLGEVLDRLFTLPKVVRHYVTAVLRQSAGTVSSVLAERIAGAGTPYALASWVELARALDAPMAIAAAIPHATHPEVSVRREVAKALGRHAGPESARALAGLLEDDEPSVRAAAARALGDMGAPAAAPMLAPRLADPAWPVRLRAGLALAQLGERGRTVLRQARAGDDRFARDMAAMVSGLSESAVLELGDL